jgi:hypothetical protein
MVLVELAVNLIIPVSIIAFCYLRICLTICRREQSGSGYFAPKVRYTNGRLKYLTNFFFYCPDLHANLDTINTQFIFVLDKR